MGRRYRRDDSCGQGSRFELPESLKQFPAMMAMMAPGERDRKIVAVGDVK